MPPENNPPLKNLVAAAVGGFVGAVVGVVAAGSLAGDADDSNAQSINVPIETEVVETLVAEN